MTASFWLSAERDSHFLAVCGFAWWASRLIAEAANSSAQAAEQAAKAATDAERTATDIREMRECSRTWLNQQQTRARSLDGQQTQGPPVSGRPVRTDTAEAQAVITPQAITSGSDNVDLPQNSPGGASRSQRGRHASNTDPSWSSALVRQRAGSRHRKSDRRSKGGPLRGSPAMTWMRWPRRRTAPAGLPPWLRGSRTRPSHQTSSRARRGLHMAR